MNSPVPSVGLRYLVTLLSIAGASPLVGQSAADSGCGRDPAVARATVLGRLEGVARDPRSESPWYIVYGLPEDSVSAIASPGQCTIVAAAALTAARTPDSLPLLGVVRLGDRGFIVVRWLGPTGSGQRISNSFALLDAALEVRSYQRISY